MKSEFKAKKKLLVITFIFALLTLFQGVFANISNAYTASELAGKLSTIRNTSGYRPGDVYTWNDAGYYSDYCSLGTGYLVAHTGWECHAYGLDLFDTLFQQCANCMPMTYDAYDLYVGDLVRVDNDTHTIIVTDISADGTVIAYTQANWGGAGLVSWDNLISVSDLQSRLTFIRHATGNNVKSLSDTTSSSDDTEAPTIIDCYVDPSSMTGTSYTVYAKATDNVGVTEMWFPTRPGDENDFTWMAGTYDSSTCYWYCTIKYSDFSYKTDLYVTHIYAKDAAGNQTGKALQPFPMSSKVVTSLGNFSARIVPVSSTGYALGISGTSKSSSVVLKTKSQSTASQVWVFTKNSDNTYTIKNKSTGYVMDIAAASDNDGTAVQIYTSNSTNAQKFYIMSYNSYYRLVPASTDDLKGIDVYGASFANNQVVDLYEACNTSNSAQTFKFEKVVTSISLSSSSASLSVGETKALSVTYTPSSAYYKSVTWKSSNTSVATVSSSGIVTAVGAGTATITTTTADGGAVTATCKITVASSSSSTSTKLPYTDVSSSDWYYEAVKYLYEESIMTGIGDGTKFAPNTTLTRGMLVTVLYRMEGEPSVSSSSSFSDVKDTSKYYYDAVIWANKNGVVTGYGSTGLFKPDKKITREELALMLYRYAGYKGKDTTATASLSSFADSSSVSEWAKAAVQWAVGKEIITGVTSGSKTYIKPGGNATRAQAATMIYRYINL